jgi:hydroxymethylbilane synthase
VSTLRIGTRGSELALWQAKTVAALLYARGQHSEIIVIKTTGDQLQQGSLSASGGRRLFVKEIEDALLGGHVDIAVHSAKDMPSESPEALHVTAVLPREDPRDALVLPGLATTDEWHTIVGRLRTGATIGTTSVRRIAQLTRLIPAARFVPLRGNVDTRLRKLDEGQFDAIVLAAAGLKRLGYGYRISAAIPQSESIPAPGQGIVAVQIRRDDRAAAAAVAPINDAFAFASLEAERAVVLALGGGCQLPLGAIATPHDTCLRLDAFVGSVDGRERIGTTVQGPAEQAAMLGRLAADQLIEAGATRLLDAVRATADHLEPARISQMVRL